LNAYTPNAWDEADFRAAIELKRGEWQTHAATLKARGQAVPAMPEPAYVEFCETHKIAGVGRSEPQKVRALDLVLTYEILEAETAKLRALASLSAAPAKPAAQAATAPAPVKAAAPAPAGPQPITAEEAAKMTATELCRAAKAGRKLPDQPEFKGATLECVQARAKNNR
jgi:hypothetical protein